MATNIKQYLRQWSLQINGKRFIDSQDGGQSLRCVFDIEVRPGNTLAYADIQIYNLAKTTTIRQHDDIALSAGYQDQFDLIFVGSVTNIFKERRGPDVVTRLLCSSFRRGTVSASYGPGAKLTDAIKSLANAWPLTLEMDESQFTDKDVFPTGWTAFGDIPVELNSLAYAFGFDWIQDRGSLVVTRTDKQRSTTVFDINQYTGMEGMPEVNMGPDGLGVDVTTRINPFIRTSSRINVKSEYSTYDTGNLFIPDLSGDATANGEYNVFSILYSGDTHGDRWSMRIYGIRAGTRSTPATSTKGSLVWGAAVSQEFRAKVRDIAKRQNLNPDWYMAVMAFETGRTFSPSKKNGAGSSATGLIQFLSNTARGLGTSTQALANMTAVQQLDYVEKYFQPHAGRIHNLGDMYMAVFMPDKGIGKSDDTVLIDRDISPTTYNQNASLDANHDGKITRGEAVAPVNRIYVEGQANKG